MSNEYAEHVKKLRDQYSDLYYNFEPGDDAFNEESGALIERCAATVNHAYRNGHYAHMWEAFAEAIRDRGDDPSDIIHDIKHETIHTLGWDRDTIHPDAFSDPMFERMVKEACGDLHYNPLSALLCQLTEYTDDETNLTRDNNLAVIEQVARTLLAINPRIHSEALNTLAHHLPYARHHYIDQYVLGAPREADTALAIVGEQALRAETLPGHVIRYNRQFTPTPSATREMRDAAAWWRSEITRAEQRGYKASETVARYAHAHAALTLMHGSSLPVADLAMLIGTMQVAEETSGRAEPILAHACDWGPFCTCDYTLNMEALIDEAAGRMETR
jgi:hypothetical protein